MNPHSIDSGQSKAANDTDPLKPKISGLAVTKAARFTLISMYGQSIGTMAMKYRHRSDEKEKGVAYAWKQECVYGPRFAYMDRFSQSFVMAHEVSHHGLGHIHLGAILYKREARFFNFTAHNMACDVVVNWLCSRLPQVDDRGRTSSAHGAIVHGVRKCQEMGIVEWDSMVKTMTKRAERAKVPLDPVFGKDPSKLTSTQIYLGIMSMARLIAGQNRAARGEPEKKSDAWEGLIGRMLKLAGQAVADPAHVYKTDPIELTPTHLHDALASIARDYAAAPGDGPADLDGTEPTEQDLTDVVTAVVDACRRAQPTNSHLHVFSDNPRRTSVSLWNELRVVIEGFEQDGPNEGDGEDGTKTIEDFIQEIADELNAHDDLREAIEEAAKQSEGALQGELGRIEASFRRAQAGASKGDAILTIAPPLGFSRTPWHRAMRRMLSNALISKHNIDPMRPSRRTLASLSRAGQPGSPYPDGIVPFHPHLAHRVKAKKCVVVIDTSGSMFCDREMISRCIREVASICNKVHATIIVIFADCGVCDVVDVKDSMDLIRALEPKGGGGTDFRPALLKAAEFKPDIAVYLTDLMGTFPSKAPKFPVIWAFPPEYEQYPTPFGLRLPLSD